MTYNHKRSTESAEFGKFTVQNCIEACLPSAFNLLGYCQQLGIFRGNSFGRNEKERERMTEKEKRKRRWEKDWPEQWFIVPLPVNWSHLCVNAVNSSLLRESLAQKILLLELFHAGDHITGRDWFEMHTSLNHPTHTQVFAKRFYNLLELTFSFRWYSFIMSKNIRSKFLDVNLYTCCCYKGKK